MTAFQELFTVSNATKAQILAAINAVLGLLIAFHVVFTQEQMGAIDVAINAIASLIVGLTFQLSAMRKTKAEAAPKKPRPRKPAVKKPTA